MSERDERRVGDRVGVLTIAVAAALPPLLIYPLPTHDGPQHAFAAFALNRLGAVELGFGSVLTAHFPLSSQGFVLLLAGLDRLLPFAFAERLAVALTLVAFPLVGWAYARLARRPALPVVGLLTLTAYGWTLAMGFLNFLLAVALLPLPVGLMARQARRGPRARGMVAVGVTLLLLAWLHIAAAAVAGLLVLAVASSCRRPLGAPAAAVLAGAPAAAWAVFSTTRYVGTHAGLGFITGTEAHFEPIGVRLTGLLATGPGALSWVSALVVTAAYLWVIVQVVRSRPRRSSSVALVLMSGLFVLAYLLSPLHVARWAYLSPRWLMMAGVALSLVSFSGLSSHVRRGAWVIWVILGVLGASLGLLRMERQLEPVHRGVVAAPRTVGAPLLYLELEDNAVPAAPRHVEPTLHAGLRSLLVSGGFTPYLFAFNRAAHTIRYRQPPEVLVGPAPGAYIRRGFECAGLEAEACLGQQHETADRIAYYATRWRELLVAHAPEVLSLVLRRRGFRLAYEDGPVALWVARPAELRVAIELPPAPLPGDLTLRVGYPESVGWVAGARLPAGTIPPQPLTWANADLMPGPTVVEVFIDGDGDGEPDSEAWHWREAIELAPSRVTALTGRLPTDL